MDNIPSKNEKKFAIKGLEEKITTAENALSKIQPGDHIFVGSACATPRTLLRALEAMEKNLADVELFHFLTDGAIFQKDGTAHTNFKHRVFFVGTDMREAVKKYQADYAPVSIAQVPRMIDNGGIVVDVALIQTSLPDEHGFVSLGVSVDIAKSAIKNAKTIIVELNSNMPRTLGDTNISVDRIDHMVLVDMPVIEYLHPPADTVAEQIARYIARIIENGSTLQVGLGQIPNEMLKYLSDRRDLGIHSDVITEPIIDLIEKGVITGNAKSIHKGKIVCSYCMGTRRLYDFVDNNPMFLFHPIDYVCNPAIISLNTKLISVTQAFAVDLTGQVCGDQFEGEFYGGVSTQPDFLRGAASSPGGKPIICLSSTTEDGRKSRIRSLLQKGEGVTIPRSEVHYVITEYGSAYLFGKTIRERTLSLIEIAHPDFRAILLDEAKELGYVRQDQILKSKVAYPADEEREVVLKNNEKILIRPSKASDIQGLQEIFYDLTSKDVYTRFFSPLKSLSISMAEQLCNVDYENEMAFVAVAGDREKNFIVGSSCYFVDPSTLLVEVAYMILPAFQSVGLGAALQQRMVEYAKSKGFRGFTAIILTENKKMLKLANSGFSKVSIKESSGECEVTMLF
jgi:acyl-CoA hydrolase/L-amino acid N-acyltransferase YncA